MDHKAQSTVQRSYEEFQPSFDWVRENGQDTLVVSIPGFKKDHVRVVLDSRRKLRISGERPLEGNKWSRFRRDFHVPEDYDMNTIQANLIGRQLFVIIPKKMIEPNLKDPATPTEQSPASKENESKMKLEKNQKGGLTASKLGNARRKKEAHLKNIEASNKHIQAGGFEFGMAALMPWLNKRRRETVNVAVAIAVVSVAIYGTHKLRSGKESYEN